MASIPESVKLQSAPCPNGCKLSDTPVLEAPDRLHGIPGRFTVVQCNCCSLMRTNPRPTPETIGAYYPSDYAPYGTEASHTDGRRGARAAVRRLLQLDPRETPPVPPGRLLEIGCAAGNYLARMRKSGWTVEGIEFSEAAAQKARERGLTVRTGTVEDASPPDLPLDLVAAWMVLEHLHEPVLALKKIRSWLKPDGYLIASVPDAGALERRWFGPRWYALQLPTHLYHYTPQSIEHVLRTAGWTLKRVSWQRNCNNLLWSLHYLAQDKQWPRFGRAVNWLRTAPRAHTIRLLLSWLLGAVRQSGRMEIWAQPARDVVGP